MAIHSLTIENFKGIRDKVQIDFKPITLLFGPNSAGKSTIIQALHYAREIFERENVDPGKTIVGGESIDLGGFYSLVNSHDLKKSITMRFDLDLKKEDLTDYVPAIEGGNDFEDYDSAYSKPPDSSGIVSERIESGWIQISVKWSPWLNKPLIDSYEVGINDDLLACIKTSEDGKETFFSNLSIFSHPIFETGEDDISGLFGEKILEFITEEFNKGNPRMGVLNQFSALPKWGKLIELDGTMWNENTTDEGCNAPYSVSNFIRCISMLVVGPGEILRDTLRKLCYLGPIREVPSRNHSPARSPDESLWANGIAAWNILHGADDSFIKKVNGWLAHESRLNSGYLVEVKRYKELDSRIALLLEQERALNEEDTKYLKKLPVKTRLLLREVTSDIEVLPQDVGVGISQVLPVIVAALLPKNDIVAIEQPELHIHPAFQVVLGDLFITQAKKLDVLFLIETHSEHLLLRLLRRIRETYDDELPPSIEGLTTNKLAIYYIVNTEKGVDVSKLRVDETGDSLGRWPDGFFEERHKELY